MNLGCPSEKLQSSSILRTCTMVQIAVARVAANVKGVHVDMQRLAPRTKRCHSGQPRSNVNMIRRICIWVHSANLDL